MKIDYETNTLIITLLNTEDLYILLNTIEEIERLLCKKLSVDEDPFTEYNEIHIDVDDYYEYLSLRRLVLDFCPIY